METDLTRQTPTAKVPSGGDQPDFSKISFTAKFVAHGRALSDIPFAADIAQAVAADDLFNGLADDADIGRAELNWFMPMLEARYKSLTKAIERSGCKQVLEFASGVSLRGLAMCKDPEMVYVESDLPAMTAEKVALVDKIRSKYRLPAAPNLFYHSLNILAWPEVEEALMHFTADEPVAIIHEGLFPYLSMVEKAAAAQTIQRILQRFGGVWYTPDFHWHGDSVSSLWLNGPMQRVSKSIAAATERDFDDRMFESEQQVVDFCTRAGFTLKVHKQIDGSYPLTTLAHYQVPDAQLAKLKENLRLFEMRLA